MSLARKAFEFIKSNPGWEILVTDVEAFFDNVDHQILKDIWGQFIGQPRLPEDHFAVYKAVTHYSVVKKHKAYNLFKVRLNGYRKSGKGHARLCTLNQFREKLVAQGLVKGGPGVNVGKGIPQGTSLSPLLSNMYMANLDLVMNSIVSCLGGKYWRYCDDILIVVPSGSSVSIESELDMELGKLKLARNDEKTYRLSSSNLSPQKQLQYLGFTFDGSQIAVRSSPINRYHRKMKRSFAFS